jgi:hypothetical protein
VSGQQIVVFGRESPTHVPERHVPSTEERHGASTMLLGGLVTLQYPFSLAMSGTQTPLWHVPVSAAQGLSEMSGVQAPFSFAATPTHAPVIKSQ